MRDRRQAPRRQGIHRAHGGNVALPEAPAAQAVQGGAKPACHPRGDGSPRGEGQAVVRIPADIPDRSAHQRGHGFLDRSSPGARSRQRAQRRPAGVHRGHRGGRNVLRPPDRLVPRHRCAVDAGVRLSRAGQIFPRRARAIPAAHPRCAPRSPGREGIVCRRDGRAAVHALQLPTLRGGRGCGRTRRSLDGLGGHLRERRQLSQAARLECRRARAERSAGGGRQAGGSGRAQARAL